MKEWKYNALLALAFIFLLAWLVFPLPENLTNLLVDIALASGLLILVFLLWKKWLVKSRPNAP